MKKIVLLLAVCIASLLIILSACAGRKAEPLTQQTFVPANEAIANGERAFMNHCDKCHPGEGGLGPSPGTK